MPSAREDADLRLVLVDGDNVLHDLRGRRDEPGVAWLLPRLTRWRPPGLRVVIALDGHPAPGDPGRSKVATGVEFHHAGTRSADDLIIEILASQPFAARAQTAVVTRDRDLVARVRHVGGLTRSVEWLWRGLEHPNPARAAGAGQAAGAHQAGGSIGQGRPPRPGVGGPAAGDVDPGRPTWTPGRGATHKRGNPHRGPRSSSQR